MIYYNGKLMDNLKNRRRLPNLQGGVAENVFVPLQPSDDEAIEQIRPLYSLYMGVVLNSLRPSFTLNLQEQEGQRRFEEDWRVKARFDTKDLNKKNSLYYI